MKFKLFDQGHFIGPDVSINSYHAKLIAEVADEVIRNSSFVLYGRIENKKFVNFTSDQKLSDTHVILGIVPKRLQ